MSQKKNNYGNYHQPKKESNTLTNYSEKLEIKYLLVIHGGFAEAKVIQKNKPGRTYPAMNRSREVVMTHKTIRKRSNQYSVLSETKHWTELGSMKRSRVDGRENPETH